MVYKLQKNIHNANLKNMLVSNIVVFAVILFGIFVAFFNKNFLSIGNLTNILRQMGPLSIAAIGMTFVIISGYFDLSIVGIISLVSVVTVGFIQQGLPEIIALLMGIILGILCGFFEATILVFSGAQNGADATFVTYGLGSAFSALALIYCDGQTKRITGDSPLINHLGWGGLSIIPFSFIIFIFTMIITNTFLMRTQTGTEIRMMGGNREATRLSGVNNDKNTFLVFCLLGFTSALAGILNFSRTTTASAGSGFGYDTNTILSVILGGTRLSGGKGSVLRTTTGVVLVSILQNGLTILGLSSFASEVVKGAFLIFAIWLDYRRN